MFTLIGPGDTKTFQRRRKKKKCGQNETEEFKRNKYKTQKSWKKKETRLGCVGWT